jgi:RNA polymerase sigma factor (sigma-70 family)
MEPAELLGLLRRAQAADPHAVGRLLAVVRPQLEAWSQPFADPARPDESVSDLVQETWLRIWQSLDQFRGTGDDAATWAKFCSWLKTLTQNTGRNRRRDQTRLRRRPKQLLVALDGQAKTTGRTRAADIPGKEATPSTNVRANEKARRILEAVGRLPDEKDRAIVRLRFFEGLSLHQVAERLAMSYDQVRQRYRTSKQALAKALEEFQ